MQHDAIGHVPATLRRGGAARALPRADEDIGLGPPPRARARQGSAGSVSLTAARPIVAGTSNAQLEPFPPPAKRLPGSVLPSAARDRRHARWDRPSRTRWPQSLSWRSRTARSDRSGTHHRQYRTGRNSTDLTVYSCMCRPRPRQCSNPGWRFPLHRRCLRIGCHKCQSCRCRRRRRHDRTRRNEFRLHPYCGRNPRSR